MVKAFIKAANSLCNRLNDVSNYVSYIQWMFKWNQCIEL